MPSEPSWSKQISNTSVCTWFYALAILNAIIAVAGILGGLLMYKKGPKGLLFSLLLSGGVGFINAWFLFLVCSRGLHEGFVSNPRKMCSSGANQGKMMC